MILTKVRCGLSIVRKAKSYLNQEFLLILYHTMIMSHILHCITVWCHDNKTTVQKLQRSVNKFIRILFNLNPRDGAVRPMKSHTILTINHLMIKETTKFMFHFNNNRLPPVFKKFFLTKEIENLPVQTRSGSTLIPVFCRLSTTQQSYRYKDPVVWNNLPQAIRYDCKSLKKFSNEVHNHLLKL